MNATQIIPGSISAIAQSTGQPIAVLFSNAEIVTIVDVSGSMGQHDSKDGKSRYQTACDELSMIQRDRPGKVAVIAFSNNTVFCPGGIPMYEGGGTNLAHALRYAKIADVPGMNIIVISDGEPDSKEQALAVARTYKNKISTVYCGPEDRSYGQKFLTELANITGGQTLTSDRAIALSKTIETLLLKG